MREDETINGSYQITLEELFSAHSMAMKVLNSRRPWLLRQKRGDKVVAGLGTVMMLLCFAVSVALGIDSPGLYYVFVFFLLLIGTGICLPWIVERLLRRRLAKTPALDKVSHFSVSADGLNLLTKGLSESYNKWPGYLRVARTEKGFLFFQNEQVYNWLPTHAFASDRDEDMVGDLASTHAKEYLDLT